MNDLRAVHAQANKPNRSTKKRAQIWGDSGRAPRQPQRNVLQIGCVVRNSAPGRQVPLATGSTNTQATPRAAWRCSLRSWTRSHSRPSGNWMMQSSSWASRSCGTRNRPQGLTVNRRHAHTPGETTLRRGVALDLLIVLIADGNDVCAQHRLQACLRSSTIRTVIHSPLANVLPRSSGVSARVCTCVTLPKRDNRLPHCSRKDVLCLSWIQMLVRTHQYLSVQVSSIGFALWRGSPLPALPRCPWSKQNTVPIPPPRGTSPPPT